MSTESTFDVGGPWAGGLRILYASHTCCDGLADLESRPETYGETERIAVSKARRDSFPVKISRLIWCSFAGTPLPTLCTKIHPRGQRGFLWYQYRRQHPFLQSWSLGRLCLSSSARTHCGRKEGVRRGVPWMLHVTSRTSTTPWPKLALPVVSCDGLFRLAGLEAPWFLSIAVGACGSCKGLSLFGDCPSCQGIKKKLNSCNKPRKIFAPQI